MADQMKTPRLPVLPGRRMGRSRGAILPPHVLRELRAIGWGDVIGALCLFGGGYLALVIGWVLL